MKKIIISTENTCDLSKEILEERQIRIAKLHYFLGEQEFDCSEEFDPRSFYQAMRDGVSTKTSLVNEYDVENYLRALLTEGKDVVHLAFASACSGTADNFFSIAKKINADPSVKNKVYVVDTLAESGGQGLIVTLTDDFANEGKSAEETAAYAEALKHRVCHYFCVDNVKYLARGGRISKVAGFIGSIINIKPVLYTAPDGKLTPLSKEITRKKSLSKLVDWMKKKYNRESDRVYITAADCDADAEFVASLVKQEFGMEPTIFTLGPVIGSHSGPGTVALFFTSDSRNNS